MSEPDVARATAEAATVLFTTEGQADLARLRAVRPYLADRITEVGAELIALLPGPVIPDPFDGQSETRSVNSTTARVLSRVFGDA
ncbi:hypothetical protein AB0F93_00145 [Micromonospora tulbaghiae]|uniref:hypothetical protein n=1 Tax=Micromonospora tulbaghiae TaxID=479978 RepID=UPI00331AC192